MRVLITGAAGFIGANAVRHFTALGHAVTASDVRPMPPDSPAVPFVACDLRSPGEVHRLLEQSRPEFLIHLGARTDTTENRSLEGYDANIGGVRHIIEACNRCDSLRRMIVASSRLVCRIGYHPVDDDDFCPPNLYGQSKVETERIVRSSRVRAEWVLVRPTAIWGEGFQVPSYRDFFEHVRRGNYVSVRGADPVKTFGYITNTLHQIQRLLEADSQEVAGRIFYLGDYEPVRLQDWADRIADAFGVRRPRRVPRWILTLLARTGDFLQWTGWQRVPLTTYRLRNILTDSVHDCGPIRKVAGPLPVGLDVATRNTVEWMRNGG